VANAVGSLQTALGGSGPAPRGYADEARPAALHAGGFTVRTILRRRGRHRHRRSRSCPSRAVYAAIVVAVTVVAVAVIGFVTYVYVRALMLMR
jgi:hypothetical protein